MALTKEAMQAIALGRGGSYSLSRDVIKHVLHDTVLFPATAQNLSMFTTQQGSTYGTGTKGLTETNMIDSGKLPNGQTFLIQKLGISLVAPIETTTTDAQDIAQAYYNLMQHAVVEIRIAGREYDFQCIMDEFVPNVAISSDSGATNILARIGDNFATGKVTLGVIPIFVDNLVSFSALIRVASGQPAIQTILDTNSALLNSKKCELRVKLEGVLTRAK